MTLDQDLQQWVRLSLVNGLGPRGWVGLLRALGEPAFILSAAEKALAELVSPSIATAICQMAECNLDAEFAQLANWLAQPHCQLLTLADAAYPKRLLDLPDPPPLLYAQGDLGLLTRPAVSVVGSRNATAQGIANAEQFAAFLAQQSVCVISGMASGIDAAAHRGGLSGAGSSIAVVGTGLDRVYPAANRALAHQLAAQGLLLSELALGSPPKAEHFPRRNRLIAALGAGCLVVEAALESGSLITARQAADLGREVFAIPGSIHSPVAKGCHRLIKQGAKLVEAGADILEELSGNLALDFSPQKTPNASPETPDEESPLLGLMGWDAVEFDWLVLQSGLTSEALCAILLGLELEGKVASLPGNRYQRLGIAK
ncbi:DNA-processing protein DprA [Chitinibacter sp. ZOR0017]|uniref:DNA-processing protein DprA n=1 Tax=Chitinibacter sp. ZOR0017 TaxID=1339254 RepID=UPI00068CAD6C|nr:DNA-processing protein DprA [Chitinibacter sp. ZOR0017]